MLGQVKADIAPRVVNDVIMPQVLAKEAAQLVAEDIFSHTRDLENRVQTLCRRAATKWVDEKVWLVTETMNFMILQCFLLGLLESN